MKDKGGILGFGLLKGRVLKQTEDEEPELPLEKLPMKITVKQKQRGRLPPCPQLVKRP